MNTRAATQQTASTGLTATVTGTRHTAMRGFRAFLAVLMLVAFAAGAPLHHAASDGTAPGGHQHAQAAAAHDFAPCSDCPAKPDPAQACNIACAAAVAVLGQFPGGSWEPLSYPVRFDVPATRSPPGTAQVPDPFPPRRPRTA